MIIKKFGSCKYPSKRCFRKIFKSWYSFFNCVTNNYRFFPFYTVPSRFTIRHRHVLRLVSISDRVQHGESSVPTLLGFDGRRHCTWHFEIWDRIRRLAKIVSTDKIGGLIKRLPLLLFIPHYYNYLTSKIHNANYRTIKLNYSSIL